MTQAEGAKEPDQALLDEWSELAAPVPPKDQGERGHLWILPVLVLYAGFFFGPYVTLATAVIACKWRLGLRHSALLLGIAGTAWCLLQGVSIFNGGTWSEYQLQGFRSGTNFLAGIAMYVVIRQPAVAANRATVYTALGTLIYVTIAVIGFFFLPSDILIALGR